jgi:hypothetical protein
MTPHILRISTLLALLLALGCSERSATEPGDDDPKPGQTKFSSADAVAGQETGRSGADAGVAEGAPAADSSSGASARAVTEGDIYRVLDAGTILNLNSYRGLQVIDVSNPDTPTIVGRLPMVGTPVEMYVRGDRAFVLLNDWQGYYGSREDIGIERREGGLLVAVDLSKRTAPERLDSVFVEGSIKTSRMVGNDSVAALYVASSHWQYDETGSTTKTIVTSFDVTGDALARKTELDLGGYVQDIQATPDTLLVAGYDWSSNTEISAVALVDISDPSGEMTLGDTVKASGQVQSQFNMDLYNGVLRVVSTNWNGENQVETFDARDLAKVTKIDGCTFGDGQQLYATLFLQNKAFFVTYLRQDPFHAFEIRDDGTCEEHNEFIVSGWNDFFRAVSDGTRLIGLGTDDADGTRTPAVSLYDITDLANPTPLLARASAGKFQWSWSEAQSDHRAFSVLEGAVSVLAADDTEETGLVLLPYAGYVQTDKAEDNHYDMGVALFTFSDHTVTRRGNVSHDSDVRRSFLAKDDLAANLSETSLQLFDPTTPDDPALRGRVDLAPDYGRILRYGEHIVRVRRPNYDYRTDYNTAQATVQVIDADADLDTATPLAAFEVPASAQLLKAGDLLAVIEQNPLAQETSDKDAIYETRVTLHDLSDPLHPRKAGSATTTDLMPTYFGYRNYDYWGGGRFGFAECGVGLGWFDGSQADGMFALGDALVFVDARGEEETLGKERRCTYWAEYDEACSDGECNDALEGNVECVKFEDEPEVCTENLALCDWTSSGPTCTPTARDNVKARLQEDCWEGERTRYWSRYSFKALDMSDADAPKFGKLVEMPRLHEGVNVLPASDSLFFTYRTPLDSEDPTRPLVRYYVNELSFDDVNAPSVSDPINIPGEVVAVDGDRLYTKDLRWVDGRAQTYVHALTLEDGVATLAHSRAFLGRDVASVIAEGNAVFVVHSPVYDWHAWTSTSTEEEPDQTTLLTSLSQRSLAALGETAIDDWASLQAVHQGRALFNIPGGLFIANVEDPARPYAQAFFHSQGWPEQILFEQTEILIAAGRYGIERLDATHSNLLPK